MCEQKVQNSDSLILIHLYGHAEVMPYRCKMCGASECQLERMYAHIRQGHPNKVNLFDLKMTSHLRLYFHKNTCLNLSKVNKTQLNEDIHSSEDNSAAL